MPTPSFAYSPLKGHARFTREQTPYFNVIASPLRSALAISPTVRPDSSSTAPFWLVSTIACAAADRNIRRRLMSHPGPAASSSIGRTRDRSPWGGLAYVIRHSLEDPAPLVSHTATCYSYSAFPGFDEKGARVGKTS